MSRRFEGKSVIVTGGGVTIRKLVIVLAILVAVYQIGIRSGVWPDVGTHAATTTEAAPSASPSHEARASDALYDAYKHHRSNVQVEASGRVDRVLRDDTEGARHQRFIVRLDSGRTVLISHNIDLAPRVDSLSEGDAISFAGEYEWNDRGGVIHWTHHDPAGRHVAGWLRHNGKTYQ
jgi:hypothetical protein